MNSSKFFDYCLAAVFMSLAWSLRGQFGHLKGALIPGAVAAVTVAMLHREELWRRAFGWSLIMSALGFSLGGHMSYGSLIEEILTSHDPHLLAHHFFRLFLIGAVWGGLGLSFLGFSVSEKPPSLMDLVLFATVGFFWLTPLGIFNQETYDLFLFSGGLALMHLYNLVLKKSETVSIFGLAGILGFGFGFLLSVLLLFAGRNGFFKSPWPWWDLRDQVIGICGGCAVAWAVHRVACKELLPARELISLVTQRSGFIFYVVFIHGFNAFNVLTHCLQAGTNPIFFRFFAVSLLSILAIAVIFFLRADSERFLERALDHALYFSTFFFIWFMSVIGIAKQLLPLGWSHWEPAFTLFVVYSLVLSFWPIFRAYR